VETDRAPSEPLLAQRYAWKRQLARGGSAVVHLAWDSVLERPVVVKLFGPSFLAAAGGHSAFMARGSSVEGIEHPAIAVLHDFGRAHGNSFATYDYVPGGHLEQRIADGARSIDEVRRVLRRLAKALEAAHQSGVVHGQLTPAKVLFDAKGKAVLSGFAWGGETAAGRLAENAYLSPQRRDGETPTIGDDAYSLAAVVLSMLTGSVMAGPEALAPGIARLSSNAESVGMASVLSQALSRDPSERFTTPRTFRDAFEAVADGVPASWSLPDREEPAAVSPRERERHRARLPALSGMRVAAAGLAVAGLVGMSVLLIGSEADAPATDTAAENAATTPMSITSGRVAGTPGSASTTGPDGTPASTSTTDATTVTQAVAGTREAGTQASASQALADVACAEDGWKAFETADATLLFPSEAACRRVFAANACPSPPVIAMLTPGSEPNSRYVAWSEACGATEYWIEVEYADGSIQQQRVELGEGNAVELPDVESTGDVAISVIAFYEDETQEWSHTVHLQP
jgi:serine/threonine-protein kinase